MTIIERIGSAFVIIWLTATMAFFALHILPGDALSSQLAQSGANQQQIDTARAQMGLNDPLITQYFHFLNDLAHGDMGDSLIWGQSVQKLIGERLMATITLLMVAISLATIGGITMGILAAHNSIMARLTISLSLSVPLYWTATLAIILFSAKLNWLPSAGTGDLRHMILPAGILGFHTMGSIARITQINIRDVWKATFITVAHSKGLHPNYIMWKHVLKAGLIPIISVIALQAGFLFSGTVITESIFVRPGIGRLLIDSTLQQDYPVVQGIVILSALIYTTFNMLADILQQFIDPRLRH